MKSAARRAIFSEKRVNTNSRLVVSRLFALNCPDSNWERQNQNLLCYHYTTVQSLRSQARCKDTQKIQIPKFYSTGSCLVLLAVGTPYEPPHLPRCRPLPKLCLSMDCTPCEPPHSPPCQPLPKLCLSMDRTPCEPPHSPPCQPLPNPCLSMAVTPYEPPYLPPCRTLLSADIT